MHILIDRINLSTSHRALNHFRSEIYAYPLTLIHEVASRQQVIFFCMDVTCKFVPYLHKVITACPEDVHLMDLKPLLSIMHAKAHEVKCEVNLFPFLFICDHHLIIFSHNLRVDSHELHTFVFRSSGEVGARPAQAPPWVSRWSKLFVSTCHHN